MQAEAAAHIQGLHRMYRARLRLRSITKQCFEKRFHRDANRFYYCFAPDQAARQSAEAKWQWTKPR